MEVLNEKRVIYPLIIIILIFAFIILYFLGSLASVAMEAREDNKLEEFFPQKVKQNNGGATSAIITPDIIFVGSFYLFFILITKPRFNGGMYFLFC